ncbi:hypothetical protein EDB19DRAFT_1859686 [Suillus lakei]|nr:hypothetical protein EDB19DRAFT_1859686 [Suillus lakei]
MGGFMLYVNGEPYHTLEPNHILRLIREGFIEAPKLTGKQINDKSKGNVISKGLIILQVAWFVMQLIARAIYHLETTQLEVGTLAFAVLNFLTYAVWWNKPLGVRCPYPVYWKSTESPESYFTDVDESHHSTRFRNIAVAIIVTIITSINEVVGAPHIPTSRKFRVPTFDGSIILDGLDKSVLMLVTLLMATIFGGIHCMVWFFAFQTYQEQVLWRMSAVAITTIPGLCFLMLLPCVVDFAGDVVTLLTLFVSLILYITARAILLVLMVTTLHHLPLNAYRAVVWTTLVPHL